MPRDASSARQHARISFDVPREDVGPARARPIVESCRSPFAPIPCGRATPPASWDARRESGCCAARVSKYTRESASPYSALAVPARPRCSTVSPASGAWTRARSSTDDRRSCSLYREHRASSARRRAQLTSCSSTTRRTRAERPRSLGSFMSHPNAVSRRSSPRTSFPASANSCTAPSCCATAISRRFHFAAAPAASPSAESTTRSVRHPRQSKRPDAGRLTLTVNRQPFSDTRAPARPGTAPA